MDVRLDENSIRPVHPEWYNEVLAIEKHGFKWMSFVGIPVRGADGYPEKMRVRQLMSPGQMESDGWKEHFVLFDGREADGSEPLAYTYCSSNCSVAMVPDLVSAELAIELARCVTGRCKSVPHDIGIDLATVVRKHLVSALR